MRLLLVEDDPMIGESVRKGLQQDGFAVDWVRDGISAEAAWRANPYDLMLLDLGLPRKDGVAVLQGLRRAGKTLPVLIMTARDAVRDRVAGLDAGADDRDLRDRRVADALRPELGEHPLGDAHRAAHLGDVLTHDEDVVVAAHRLAHGVAHGLPVGHRGHQA